MPAITGSLIAAGVGAAASVTGSAISAGAQGGIAKSQAEQAAMDRAAALQFAAPTPQEIQQISTQVSNQQRYQAVQEAGLARDQKLLGSLDPALIQAGQQANQLMQGKSAAILAPMKQQQQFERNQLQSRLAAQLGPGFATSSAGQAALQQFDMQSNLQSQQAQMSAFNQVSQFLGFNLGQRTALVGEERLGFQTAGNLSAQASQTMGNIQQRQANASIGTSGAMEKTAGSQYAGQAGAGQMIAGLGSSLGQIGGTLAGAAIGGGSGSQANQNFMTGQRTALENAPQGAVDLSLYGA